jgi:hypothetical protein
VIEELSSRSSRRRARAGTHRLRGRELGEAEEAHAIVLADAIVVGRVAEREREEPCFFRFDSWMRAKLRAITARRPSRRGDSAACSRLLPSP